MTKIVACTMRPQDGTDTPPAPTGSVSRPMPDARRELHVKQALTRFVRNKTLPEEMETLRYNLIAARVMSGMTAVEAAEEFGYGNSTQLSLIESGKRKAPNDWKFLVQASRVYGVSIDFLLGLSPHAEIDFEVSRQRAVLRRVEEVIGGVAAGFATALVQSTEQDAPGPMELDALTRSAAEVDNALTALRERHGFDDFRGGSRLMAAVDALRDAAEPVRMKGLRRKNLHDFIDALRAGRMQPLEHFLERPGISCTKALLSEAIDSENA